MPIVSIPGFEWAPAIPNWGKNHIIIWLPEGVSHDDKAVPFAEEPLQVQTWPDPQQWDRSLRMQIQNEHVEIKNHCRDIEPNCLEYRCSLTNLTDEIWHKTQAYVCVQLVRAPDFRYFDGESVFYASAEGIQPFCKKLSPPNEWFSQKLIQPEIPQEHPLVMVRSQCGQYVLGHANLTGTWMSGNGMERQKCIHSHCCEFGTFHPGQTGTQHGVVFVIKGNLQAAFDYYLNWSLSSRCK